MTKLSHGIIGYETHFPYTFTVRSMTYAFRFAKKAYKELNDWERKECNDLLVKFSINIDKHNPAKKRQQKAISKFTRR